MTHGPDENRGPRVAVIGGGLAGLAAAAAATECGLEVELFEARRSLGGRAGSFLDPQSGQLVDLCQHVAMGCCTNWADFCRRTQIADCFERHRRLHFVGPDGRTYGFSAAAWLPAPLHLLPALLGLKYLSAAERWGIARAMTRLARVQGSGFGDGGPVGDCTVAEWLRWDGQSPRAIECFWSPILVSALSESLERASLSAARKVFVDGLLAHRRAYELEIPRVPLGEIYDRRLAAWLEKRGVRVHLGARVRRVEGDPRRLETLVLADDSQRSFDYFVLAVPWRSVRALLPDAVLQTMPSLANVEQIAAASITAVHLWLDRPFMALPHAVLVGRLGQWVFCRAGWGTGDGGLETGDGGRDATSSLIPHPSSLAPRPSSRLEAPAPFYCQVVISASHALKGRDREEVFSQVRRELEQVWPAARKAQLLHWRMVTEPAAVFSMRPGIERLRPPQRTPIANLMLAGDWTDTTWPATMEGAVRSGYLAVEGIMAALGRTQRILVPDLPRSALVRRLVAPGKPGR